MKEFLIFAILVALVAVLIFVATGGSLPNISF